MMFIANGSSRWSLKDHMRSAFHSKLTVVDWVLSVITSFWAWMLYRTKFRVYPTNKKINPSIDRYSYIESISCSEDALSDSGLTLDVRYLCNMEWESCHVHLLWIIHAQRPLTIKIKEYLWTTKRYIDCSLSIKIWNYLIFQWRNFCCVQAVKGTSTLQAIEQGR